MKKDIKNIATTPFGGGADIRHQNEPALIPSGGYSSIQNMRNMYPGLKKRPGCSKLHVTADPAGTPKSKVMSMYQFVKGKKTERHFFAQMSDSDVLESYANPPTIPELMTLDTAPATAWADGVTVTGVTSTATCVIADYVTSLTYIVRDRNGTFTSGEVLGTGTSGADNQANQGLTYPAFTSPDFALGTEVFSGTASPLPASWANLNDFMLFCNGVDLPQIYPGTGNFVDAFYVYKGSFDPMTYANIFSGTDYSIEVSDGDSATAADVSSLATLAETLDTEKITNGTFTGDTDWTKGGTAAITTYLDLPAQNDVAQQQLAGFVVGEQYKLTVTLANVHDTINIRVQSASGSYTDYTTIGTKSQYWTADSTAPMCQIENKGVGHNTADNVSFKKCIYHCLFVRTPVPVQSLGFTVATLNANAAVAAVKYWDGNSFEDVTGFSDGTIATAGKTLSGNGSMTWTAPSDEVATYLYSQCGYWYMIYLSSGSLDSTTTISACTYESAWQSIKNIWDGVPVDVIEAQKYTSSTGAYSTYAAETITLNSMASTDALYFSTYDDIEGIFVDVATPNATGDTLSLFRWDGTAWQSVSITDQTNGFSRSGRIIFTRGTSKQQDFNLTGYMAHWYKITTGSSLAASVLIGLTVQPYFNIAEIGKGQTVCAWKNQAIYGTNQDHYLYLSAPNNPQALNGDNFTLLEPGDGRFNRPVATRNFADDLMVWQEEKGKDGGCLTKFSWVTDITDIKTTLISTSLGIMNSKCVDIVDGVEASELNRDVPVMTLAFCLSRKGVYITDGSAVYMISKDIANYFDPTDATCIRAGYETEHWLKYDSAYGVIRIGLVSGSSATVPNVFPVYDVKLKTWSTDSLTQEFSCMTETEAASGSVPVVQVGGGTDDGFVYLLNTGTNDVSTAITSYATLEFDMNGYKMHMDELLLRVKSQAAGDVTVTPYINGQAQSAKTLSMTAATANDQHRRHRENMNLVGDHISLKIQHATASQDCYLLDYGAATEIYNEQ